MKRFKILLFFIGISILTNTVYSQCDITPNKFKGCVGDNFRFSITLSPLSYYGIKWTFGNGDSSTIKTSFVGYTYKNPGKYTVTVTLYSDAANTIKCGPYSINIVVYDMPNANFKLPIPSEQCLKGNIFHFFDNSTMGINNAPIISYYWDFSDGAQSHNKNTNYSYSSSGTYSVHLIISDTNGCIDTATRISSIKVFPDLNPKFKTTYKISCPVTDVKFDNLSDSNGRHITTWHWDFGDGYGDSSMSSWNTQFTHSYRKDGAFNPKLVLESSYGCKDSFIYPAGARNIFYWFNIKKNISSPVCWNGNKICFNQKYRPNAYYWLWTFDDPASQNLNNDDHNWDPCHQYSSPGIYHINLKIWEPNCIRDTTYCAFVSLSGPQAMIKLPAPAKNSKCEAGKRIPISVFEMAYGKCLNPTGSPVTYQTSKKVAKFVSRTDSFYCNAPVSNVSSVYKTGCIDSFIIKTNYTLKYAQGTTKYYDSFVYYSNNWYPGDPYPWVSDPINSKVVYYPEVKNCNYKNIHDSDQYITNCSGPNMVFFPNNSVKYRLRYNIDNNPASFTIPPGKDKSMDKCANKSYPWASDSMQYLWDFGDAYALSCTSTVSIPNSNCKYSTEITPFHNYKKSGCYSATLKVTDTVMKCISTTSISISMEAPDAGWDYNVFKTMILAGFDTLSRKLDWSTQKQMPSTWGRRGMILEGVPCVGQLYTQKPDFTETKPSCDRQKWWMVFDSAADCTGFCKDSVWADTNGDAIKDKLIKTKLIQCSWIDDLTFSMMGNKWIYQSGGCKTVGLIIKTGDCYDTFWYNQYKYIADVQPAFNIIDPNSYNIDSARYIKKIDSKAQYKLCPPFQAILTVKDTAQSGITYFDYSINKTYSAPWTKPWQIPLEDSCKKTKTYSYMLCDKSKFTVNPFPPFDTTWTNCFIFPNPNKNCGVSNQQNATLQYYLSKGYFKYATYKMVDLRDTLFMKDSLGNSLLEPGKYSVTSIIRNLYGCYNFAQTELFVGYYTDFEANNQIICAGSANKVSIKGNIRYFNLKMFPYDPELNSTNYWNDPVGSRGGHSPALPSVIEKVEWDLNGDGIYGDGATGVPDSVSYLYSYPGNYTVRMRTTDSNGCVQVLEKKNYIHVMGLVADFDTANAVFACAPQTVKFTDNSYGLNVYEYLYNIYGQKIDSTLLDSVVSWKWNFGDNLPFNGSISNLKNPIHTYAYNGCYDVSLVVQTNTGCSDTIVKSKYICINGPVATFKLLDSVGYAPLSVRVKDRSKNTKRWEFVKGDNTTSTFYSRPSDSIFTLVYNTAGTYHPYLRASDSIFNPALGKYITCISEYAEPYDPFDPQYTVIVSPTSIEDAVKSKEFYVYPVPFSESFNVFLPENKNISRIQLIDMSGRAVLFRKNIKGNNMEIFRDDIPQGIYLLKIVSDKVYVFKIIAE